MTMMSSAPDTRVISHERVMLAFAVLAAELAGCEVREVHREDYWGE